MNTGENTEPRPSGSEPPENIWSKLPVVALMALVLLAAGVLSAMTAMRFAIQGREVIVPSLVGLDEAGARRALAGLDLDLVMDSPRFSPEVPEGMILAQSPAAGTPVKRNRSVRALLSLGERRFAVPDLQGASLRSAQLMLTQRGFTVGDTLFVHSGEGAEGAVLFQSPPAGDLDREDPAIDLLVSVGSADRYYVMPSFTGQRASEVVARIRREGFRAAEPTGAAQAGVDPGRVIRQQPPAGFRVSRDDLILLEVSQ